MAIPVEIPRELVAVRLGRVTEDRFLFYLKGPYKSFNLNAVLSEEDRRDIDYLPGPLPRLFQHKDDFNAAQALVRRVQGDLRTDPEWMRFSHSTSVSIPTTWTR